MALESDEIFLLEKKSGQTERQAQLESFRIQIAQQLPSLNISLLRGQIPFVEFQTYIEQSILALNELSAHSESEARMFIGWYGLLISSFERQASTYDVQPGSIFHLIPTLEQTLIHLGEVAHHPPRDTVYTYALWNTGEERLTFTGDSQEHLFLDVIRESTDAFESACESLRMVDTQSIIDNMMNVDDVLQRIIQLFQSYFQRTADGKRALDPEFFVNTLMHFNIALTLNGEEWEAPTGSHNPWQWMFDISFGIVDDAYTNRVKTKLKYLTREDADRIADRLDSHAPTYLDSVLTKTLGMTQDQFTELSPDELLHIRKEMAEIQLRVFHALNHLVKTYERLTATHWSLVHNFVIHPLEKYQNYELQLPEIEKIRDQKRSSRLSVQLDKMLLV